jgi:hypothetical protein
MKKIILTSLPGLLLCLVTCLTTSGQIAKANSELAADIPSFENGVPANTTNVVDRKNVDQKALKNFSNSFKVANETWYTLQAGFAATFTSNGIDHIVSYDKKGKWVHTVRSYDEAKMQDDLRHAIRSSYYDYQINKVTEIEAPTAPVTYIVQLVGKTKLINLRISNGDMEEWQKFNRSE